MNAAIEVEGLAYTYEGGTLSHESEGFRLSIPDLRIAPGEKIAFIGPSGSGKTTLLHLLAGILTPDEGEIRVLGEPVSRLPDALRRRLRIGHIGLIFQEFELIDHLTVRENVLLPYLVSKALKLDRGVEQSLGLVAESLGIGNLLRRRPRALSHGERQRVAIARALVTQPDLVLADEPTGNLDPANSERILDLVFLEVSQRGLTFAMVTHDHSLLPRFDRVVDFMDLGAR